MRAVMMSVLFLGIGTSLTAADDRLDDKFLMGKWAMASVLDPPPKKKSPYSNIASGTIEFKDDGTYEWKNNPVLFKGTYTMKGTTLVLTSEGKLFQEWKDMSIKDGKVIQPLGKGSKMIFTRVTASDPAPDKKKDK